MWKEEEEMKKSLVKEKWIEKKKKGQIIKCVKKKRNRHLLSKEKVRMKRKAESKIERNAKIEK